MERHPMVDLIKTLWNVRNDKNVDIEKVMTIKKEHRKNYLYNSLIIQITNKLVECGLFDKARYQELLKEFYGVNEREPYVLQYMGDYYKEQSDPLHAAKCYEKSLSITPDREVLKKIDTLPQSMAAVKLLNSASHHHVLKVEKSPGLYVRLALLNETNAKKCIEYLQSALKLNNKDPMILELLADKYLKCGKYTSALKCFHHANVLESTSYRRYNMANILLVLGRLSEAVLLFEDMLKTYPSYSPALKGYVACIYRMVVRCLQTAKYQRAVGLANQCLEIIDRLVLFEPRWSSTCKYLGDVCLLVAQVRDALLLIPSNIAKLFNITQREVVGEQIIELAIKSYQKGLMLNTRVSEYLVDITRAYLHLAEYHESYLAHALTFGKRAVLLRPKDHIAWNLLGSVCLKHKGYKLAQHALIRSLYLNKESNPEAWTNLGLLYLHNRDYELANECFSEAQNNDPKYAQSWVAQAHLAKSMPGYETEATKLFKDIARDTTRDMTVEGTLGHVLELFKSDLKIARPADVHDALTIVSRCTHLSESGWIMFNACGVLCEHLKLYSQALQNYIKAQTLAPDSTVRSSLQTNVNRVQCRKGNYSALPPHTTSFVGAAALMRLGLLGQASSILDAMAGQDVAVFQAVLAWLSKDTTLAKSFLEHPNSDIAELLKCLILKEAPRKSLKDAIYTRSNDLQAKYTCSMLDYGKGSMSDQHLYKLPSNSSSLYVLLKFMVTFRQDPRHTEAIIRRLNNEKYFQEDIYDLEFENLLMLEQTSEPINAECDALIDENIKMRLKRCAQNANHLFPWRPQSTKMLYFVQQL